MCLDDNQICDVAPLAQLTGLTELWLENNQIACTHPTVEQLKARGCKVFC
eukprot:SAG22_NODE_9263_length_599_cov_12.418000_2_plen_50_part_00